MYRVTDIGSDIYAAEFHSIRREVENIEGLLEAGDHVLIVNELEDAAKVFGVDVSEITVIETDD